MAACLDSLADKPAISPGVAAVDRRSRTATMTPERWRQITDVFHAALGRDGALRGPFLDEACADDRSMRAEVEALLSAHERAGPFGAQPFVQDGPSGLESGVGPDLLEQKSLSHYQSL